MSFDQEICCVFLEIYARKRRYHNSPPSHYKVQRSRSSHALATILLTDIWLKFRISTDQHMPKDTLKTINNYIYI